jgi:hypothetical protein
LLEGAPVRFIPLRRPNPAVPAHPSGGKHRFHEELRPRRAARGVRRKRSHGTHGISHVSRLRAADVRSVKGVVPRGEGCTPVWPRKESPATRSRRPCDQVPVLRRGDPGRGRRLSLLRTRRSTAATGSISVGAAGRRNDSGSEP